VSSKVTSLFFSLNPSSAEVERITKRVRNHSRCITFISNAMGNDGQRILIKKLQKCDSSIIFVLLDNPFDYEFMSSRDTCITSYGLRKIQLSSLLKVIFGKAEATGKLPFKK
jgi:hypothetical protein